MARNPQYRCLDRILPYKTKLERHLKQRSGELFGAEFDVLLYDLTSTYVEGAAEKNPMLRRRDGRSPAVVDQRRPQALPGSARRRLHVTYQSAGRYSRRTLVTLHGVD